LLHLRKIAHRNINPFNIILSLKDYKFKLNHLEFALDYESVIGYYDIVGDKEYLPYKLRNYFIEREEKLIELEKVK